MFKSKYMSLTFGLFCYSIISCGLASAEDICDNVTNATQADLNACSAQQYQTADKELNQFYNELAVGLDRTAKKLLLQSELSWIKFRDTHCAYEADYSRGGSMAPMVYSNCLNYMTKDRIRQLKTNPVD